jgi:plastocyanin
MSTTQTRFAVAMAAVALLATIGASTPAPTAGATDAASAAGAEITVRAGVNPTRDPTIAVLEYLPRKVRVPVGATVTWSWKGAIEPHSVTFLAPDQELPPPGSDVALFAPTPPTAPYDGTAFVNSGLQPLGPENPLPFSMTFSKPGRFPYHCVIHPDMVGRVDVVEDGRTDTQPRVTRRARAQQRKWVAEGIAAKRKLFRSAGRSTRDVDGTKTWVVETGTTTKHTDVLAFAPSAQRVRAGDRVRFVNNSLAPHTATFPGAQPPITDPIGPQTDNPAPGPSPQTLDRTNLFNSGLLPPKAPAGPGRPAPPRSVRSFTFVVPEAGKYPYYCILHTLSGMGGEIRAR